MHVLCDGPIIVGVLPGSVMDNLEVASLRYKNWMHSALRSMSDSILGIRFSRAPGDPKAVWDSVEDGINTTFRIHLATYVLYHVLSNGRSIHDYMDITSELPLWTRNVII